MSENDFKAGECSSRTKEYSDTKECWAPGAPQPLGNIPQLKALYKEGDASFARMDAFLRKCETELGNCLRNEAPPPEHLALRPAHWPCALRAQCALLKS